MSDSIIKKFDLKQHYNVLNNFKARKILGNNVDTGFDKYGLLNISVTDSNPQFAYRIAQAYEQNLASFIRLYSFTESSRRRIYFERQLPEVKKSLEEARNKLKIAEHYSNITSSDSRVVTLLKKSAEFKAKIAMKELELEFMQSLNMTSNPNYLRSQEELNGLWIEFGNVAQNDIASFKISLKDNEYLSSLQSFEYAETRYEQLIKLIEKAKLDERLDIPVIQVVSAVEIPQEKTGPNRLLIVELCMAVTFFITIIWAFIAESFQQIKSDPRSSSQLEALKRAARWK
jgi:tyrosine-protein kinase Etk/Wzc